MPAQRQTVQGPKDLARMEAAYHPAGDKVLISKANMLKAVSREQGGRSDFFSEPAALFFGNRVQTAHDQVRLFITPQEVKQLVTSLDWSDPEVHASTVELLRALKSSFDGCSMRAPLSNATLAVAALTSATLVHLDKIEKEARTLAAAELSLAEVPKSQTKTGHNAIDLHKLLSVLTSLGEQLHQAARASDSLPASAKQVLLGQSDLGRAHTALGRLGSLLSLPTHQRVSPITLAEHGICNTRDTNLSTGLRFFQHMSVRLDNIFDLSSAAGSSQLQAALEAQFKSNLMLRGFDTWNVPLHKSLNSMPP